MKSGGPARLHFFFFYRECTFLLKLVLFKKIYLSSSRGRRTFTMAAVAVLRNETLQAFLQVCAQVSVYFVDFNNL